MNNKEKDKCLFCTKPLTQRMKDAGVEFGEEKYCTTKCAKHHATSLKALAQIQDNRK